MVERSTSLLETKGTGDLRKLINIGHRGSSAHAPEHTIPAYDLAIAHGAQYIELDIHMTSDGELVVAHDATLERTAQMPAGRCTGVIGTMTLNDLRHLDVGSWFNATNKAAASASFTGLQILTLDQVLDRYRHCLKFCIEPKGADGSGRLERKLLETLDRYGMNRPSASGWRVLVLSFERSSLELIHSLNPLLPLIELFDPSQSGTEIERELPLVAGHATGIAPYLGAVDEDLVAAAGELGLGIHPYTVNRVEDMARLMALGVRGMITDRPDSLDALIWATVRGVAS